MELLTIPFNQITNQMVAQVGGKNASLGEMYNRLSDQGVCVPNGFAITTAAYRLFLRENHLEDAIRTELSRLDKQAFSNLTDVGAAIRARVQQARIPHILRDAISEAYRQLQQQSGQPMQVAARSSATAEDLATASFAGQHESFLNLSTEEQLWQGCLDCYVSLFTDRAIKYREDNGFEHLKVALSVGVQCMVRSDKASSGVCFTVDPESGHPNLILVTGSWGLGENVVLGRVNPDEYYVFKPFIGQRTNTEICRKLGDKSQMLLYAEAGSRNPTVNVDTPPELREKFVLTPTDVSLLGRWASIIERHYGQPMDIEWAKDGITDEFFIVQARPVTTLANPASHLQLTEYRLEQTGTALAKGKGIGQRIVTGTARVVHNPADAPASLSQADIIVTDITTPDWDPILKKVSAIITNRGGRTSHAAIVAREVGALAVVGTLNATQTIADGSPITVCCTDGQTGTVYAGTLPFSIHKTDISTQARPRTHCHFILADPDQAPALSQWPAEGVGLLRLEFTINNTIGIHPMALATFDTLTDQAVRDQIAQRTKGVASKGEFFVDALAQAVAMVAASFYPRPVIVRMSDFKTNEYAGLLGGHLFEPSEENPMLGFRGASRYYDDRYAEGFRLECAAMRRVRIDMGYTNVKLMIPFCRTVDEGRKVLRQMARFGLQQHTDGLEVYVMAEIPSNILLADQFAALFDGFSIGSNDLTQLTLGVDRDSSTVHGLFNENDPAVRQLIHNLIEQAHRAGRPVGICGQGPSDSAEFAAFLVEAGIDSISLNADAFLRGREAIARAEYVTEPAAG